jgi:unsaturated rhamnogalacturonyl hydrolase
MRESGRRHFLGGLAGGTLAAGLGRPAAAGAGTDTALTDRVARAMLSMQRAAWEQGVAAQAFLERGDTEMVVLFAREAALRQSPDGRLANFGEPDNVTDMAANGEPVLRAADHTRDPALRTAADRMLEYLMRRAPRSPDGTIHHVSNKPELWVDSMYMAPPFLAVAGEPAEAMRQVEGLRRRLWNRDERLFSHIWDDGEHRFVRQACWGVGNGWAAAGMVRVRAALPPSMAAERDRLAGYVKETIDGCLARQRPDGLFHDVLDEPSTFVETNLAQMLAYSIYRGVDEGWLEGRYSEAAERMRAAALAKVDAEGYVRGVCGSPTFDRPGTATEGQAFCLLMEAARAAVGRSRSQRHRAV